MKPITTHQSPEPNEKGNYVFGLDLGAFLEESKAKTVFDVPTVGIHLEINGKEYVTVSWELEDGCWLVECRPVPGDNVKDMAIHKLEKKSW